MHDIAVPVFEIDQPDVYGEFFLRTPLECLMQLRALKTQRSIASLYLGNGERFFLSNVLDIDEAQGLLIFDASTQSDNNELALKASQLTLTASVEKIKVQMHLGPIQLTTHEGRPAFSARIPERILRLQRREFFRIETSLITPLRCKFAAMQSGKLEVFDLPLHDMSGRGLSLIGKIADAEKFMLGELIHDCRLEIPEESVLSVNLKICEILKLETFNGDHQLRLGCEFINLPGTRQTLIERYITRLERARSARKHRPG